MSLTTANHDARAQSEDQLRPVLAELFTSQGCSSCPAAERVFNELAKKEGVVAIQWHVDYWDTLVHGRAGKWKDPYSSQANTLRQRDYNYALRGTGSVYTPQAVIGGTRETIGSHTETVSKLIDTAPAAKAAIEFEQDDDGYTISINPLLEVTTEAEAMLVMLIQEDEIDIEGGENMGLSLQSRNVAISSDMLGAWSGKAETYRVDLLPDLMSENYSCAVIVQDRAKGQVLAASYCPSR